MNNQAERVVALIHPSSFILSWMFRQLLADGGPVEAQPPCRLPAVAPHAAHHLGQKRPFHQTKHLLIKSRRGVAPFSSEALGQPLPQGGSQLFGRIEGGGEAGGK